MERKKGRKIEVEDICCSWDILVGSGGSVHGYTTRLNRREGAAGAYCYMTEPIGVVLGLPGWWGQTSRVAVKSTCLLSNFST